VPGRGRSRSFTPKESERWLQSQGTGQPAGGRLGSLFESAHLRSTLVGVGLATVGMATFWGTFIFGKNVLLDLRKNEILATLPPDASAEEQKALLDANRAATGRADMLGMLLVTTGGGIGLLFFGPLSERLGRRGAFLFFHLGAVAIAMILFRFTYSEGALYFLLPVFGLLTLGIHAGYAVYFPELYPTHLRSTGAGFCFNVGRLLAAPMLIVNGIIEQQQNLSITTAAALMSLLYLVGAVLLLAARETRGQELPD
jgi:predicted MFS family arabinose efflux permease